MGSSTKPIWAAAVLETHPNVKLHEKFKVSGKGGSDNSVFGIPVSGKTWQLHSRDNLVDFNTYLSQSNNRYQVLLGFLGLATSEGNEIAVENETSPSNLEQMNGNIWRKYPKFQKELKFDFKNSNDLINLADSPLAKNLTQMFGVITSTENRSGYKPYFNSFWSKNENDDIWGKTSKSVKRVPILSLPVRTNFRFDKINTPRQYVSWLLGGGENKWSNVHVAAAFASCITGRRTLPHIIQKDLPPVFSEQLQDFKPIAEVLRPGLAETVKSGTARPFLFSAQTHEQ